MPRRSLKSSWPRLAARLRAARRLWIACDFDGTLSPLAHHPHAARFPRATRRALSRLARMEGVHVAVISGRPLTDLRRRVAIRGVFLAGTSGLATQAPGERPVSNLPPGLHLRPALRRALEACCADFPGAWCEDKGPAVAVHYRAVRAGAQRRFRTRVRGLLASPRDRVMTTWGKKVIEVAPFGRWNKGTALRRWRGRRRGLLLFFGDDANDAPAFAHTRHARGIGVAVGPVVSPDAHYRLAGPSQVAEALARIAAVWARILSERP